MLEENLRFRSFWRINFDVIDKQQLNGAIMAEPRLLLEMTLWDPGSATRFGRSVTAINPIIHGNVVFQNGVAVFSDGFIEGSFNRTALEQELLAGAEFGVISNPFGDQNVSIVTQVRLPDDGQQEERPLFYMGQPSTDGEIPPLGQDPLDGVRLIEKIDGGNRSVKWSISGDDHETGRLFRINDQPDTDPPRGWHRVRVHQDSGTLSTPYVYEILADSFPLDYPLPANPSSHRFYGPPVDFYIGGMPDGSGGMIGLHGEMSFLEFDPNSSCGTCAG